MVVSTDDRNRVRGDRHSWGPVLNAVPFNIVASAQINQTTFRYPLYEVDVDNTSADWITASKEGYMFTIGTAPGLADITSGIVRKTPSSTRFYLDPKGLGDSGYAQQIHVAIANNQYISVIKYRPPWTRHSSIRGNKFYKFWDIPYSNQNLSPDPMIYSMGPWRQAFVDSGGTATLSFQTEYHTWGKSVASMQWFGDGGSLVAGDEETEEVTYEFDPGFYEVTFTVIDTKGKGRLAYRYVWINENDPDSEFAPFSYRHPFAVTGDTRDRIGRKMTIRIGNDLSNNEIFPGQAFLLTENPKFDGETLADFDNPNLIVNSFIGYSGAKTSDIEIGSQSVSLQLFSPLDRAKQLNNGTQQLEEKQAPSNWAECTKVLSNPIGAYFYITANHAPYLIDGHDFDFDPQLFNYRRQMFGFLGNNIASQILSLNPLIVGNIGCRSDGMVRMVRHPFYMDNDERNALEEDWTWEAEDIVGGVSIAHETINSTGQVYAYGLAYNGGSIATAYASLATGPVSTQGTDRATMENLNLPYNGGQQDVQDMAGHHLAYKNNPRPSVSIKPSRNMDMFEPCDMDRWSVFELGSEYDPEGLGWSNFRMIVVQVRTTWSGGRGKATKKLEIVFEIETFGLPGIPVPVNRGGANNFEWYDWNPEVQDPYQTDMPDLGISVPVMLAWDREGRLGRTFSFTQKNVFWTRLEGFTGAVREAAIDFHSDFFLSLGNDIEAWIVTTDLTTIRVYKTSDIRADVPVWTLNLTVTPGAGFNQKVRLKLDNQNAGNIFLCWREHAGVFYRRDQDNGASWGAATLVGSTGTADYDYDYLGCDVYDASQSVIAFNGGVSGIDGKAGLSVFTADTFTAPLTELVNNPEERVLPGCVINMADDDLMWVAVETPDPPTIAALTSVTFDPGGYTDYETIVQLLGTFPAVIGNIGVSSGNVAYYTVNGSFGLNVETVVDIGANGIFESLTFDTGFIGTAGSTRRWTTVINLYDEFDAPLHQVSFESDGAPVTEIAPDDLNYNGYFRKIGVRIVVTLLTGTVGIWSLWMDNVDVQAFREYEEKVRKLYTVTDGDVWADRAMTDNMVPEHMYGIASINATQSSAIGITEAGLGRITRTSTGGSSWSRLSRTVNLGVKRSGDIVILFGVASLEVSKNIGSTLYDRKGNWISTVGDLNVFEGVTGIL